MAHHGAAAFNIKGATICSAIALPPLRGKGFNTKYQPLQSTKSGIQRLRKLQDTYRDTHMIVIDEFSVISCAMLHWIDCRLREIWPSCKHLPFGGRDVILAGDLGQLCPVTPFALYTPTSELNNPSQKAGRDLWTSIDLVCSLTSQNRGKDDHAWYDALGRLRKMEHTDEDSKLFNTRCDAAHELEAQDTTYITYRNADVDDANARLVASLRTPKYEMKAKHEVAPNEQAHDVSQPLSASSVKMALEEAEESSRERDRVVQPTLTLAIGAPVTITYNIEQRLGLCNGTKGVIFDYMVPSNPQDTIVLVRITDKYIGPSFFPNLANIVPIAPTQISWTTQKQTCRVYRTGLPLRLAYAMTIHKVQGLTCSRVVFDPKNIPSTACAYVALSRVRRRQDLTMLHVLDLKITPGQKKIQTNLQAEWLRLRTRYQSTAKRTVELVTTMQTVAYIANSK